VSFEKKDHIARIILNRSAAENFINLQLAQEMGDICNEIARDNDIYVVVVTGSGNKSFCSGCDWEGTNQEDNALLSAKMNVAATVANIDQPVIAAINGDALGEGLELALSCDISLASDGARFGFPQVASGTLPMNGGTQRLPRLIGRGKAIELILTAGTISAQEAFEIGLISKVVPGEKITEEAESLAQNIAGKAPLSLRFIKEAVNKGMDITLEQGLRLEADLYLLLHTTADRTEGIRAFLEKRSPEFKGE